MVRIFCKNNGVTLEFPEGTPLVEMLPHFEFERPRRIISAKVNNVSQGLKFRVFNNRDVEFIDFTDPSGRRVYCRSLSFMLCKAAQDVYPGSKVYMKHPLSHGYYCELSIPGHETLPEGAIERISARMAEIVAQDLPFRRYEVRTDEAVRIFRESGYDDKVKLLETSGQVYTDYYTLGDTPDYYYGRLVPTAGYLDVWGLEPCRGGMLLRVPDRRDPSVLARYMDQPKTFGVFEEDMHWNRIMGLSTVGDVNHACLKGHASELIQVSEALQEKKIVQIAEEIDRRFRREEAPVRLILVTGPSSSGKTTFCKRLGVQLKACGLAPVTFSTDDYFVNRIDTPKLPDGSYDFDNFDTVDHRTLQGDLLRLLAGEDVEIPRYNFVTGRREYDGRRIRLMDRNVVILEGIHALNPELTKGIAEERKFKIFISTLTSIPLDDHNWVPTSDNRLLRRIVRDYRKGAFSARETISQWPNVRTAEETWIDPYQENADVMFNSAYLIEFAVLRNYAEQILSSIPKNCPEYSEAHRLLKFIHYFTPVSDGEIPPTSLLREFVGGSVFDFRR